MRSEQEQDRLFKSIEASNKELTDSNKVKLTKCEYLEKKAIEDGTKLDGLIKIQKAEAAKCLASMNAANLANATSLRLKDRSTLVSKLMKSLNAASPVVSSAHDEANQVIDKVRAIKELSSALKGKLAEDLARIEEEIASLTDNSASFENEREEEISKKVFLLASIADRTREFNSADIDYRHNQIISKEAKSSFPRLLQVIDEKEKELKNVEATHKVGVQREVEIVRKANESKSEASNLFSEMFSKDTESQAQIATLSAEAKQLAQAKKAIDDETRLVQTATAEREKLIQSAQRNEETAKESLAKLSSGKGSVEQFDKVQVCTVKAETDLKAALAKTALLNSACSLADEERIRLKKSADILHQEFVDLLSTRICGVDWEDADKFHKKARKQLLDFLPPSTLTSSSSSSSSSSNKETSVTGDDNEDDDELMTGGEKEGSSSEMIAIEKIVNKAVSDCESLAAIHQKEDEWSKALLTVHSDALNAIVQKKKMAAAAAAAAQGSGECSGSGKVDGIEGVSKSSDSAYSSSSLVQKKGLKDVVGSGRRPSSAGILENGLTQICTLRGYRGYIDESKSIMELEMAPLIDSLQNAICFNEFAKLERNSSGDVVVETTPLFKTAVDRLTQASAAAKANDSTSEELIKLRKEISSFEERIIVAVNKKDSAEAYAVKSLDRIETDFKALDKHVD